MADVDVKDVGLIDTPEAIKDKRNQVKSFVNDRSKFFPVLEKQDDVLFSCSVSLMTSRILRKLEDSYWKTPKNSSCSKETQMN